MVDCSFTAYKQTWNMEKSQAILSGVIQIARQAIIPLFMFINVHQSEVKLHLSELSYQIDNTLCSYLDKKWGVVNDIQIQSVIQNLLPKKIVVCLMKLVSQSDDSDNISAFIIKNYENLINSSKKNNEDGLE